MNGAVLDKKAKGLQLLRMFSSTLDPPKHNARYNCTSSSSTL